MRRLLLALLLAAAAARAGEYPRVLRCWRGSTPTVDGVLAPGEWDDAVTFAGVHDWTPQFTPTTSRADLSLRGWVKHDGADLYFAFQVTDDVLYGIETERWLPDENPKAHELTREGYPWFGDEMELLLNPTNQWDQRDGQNAVGDGTSSQMVCNLTKSRLGGVGVGGLLEGEPRQSEAAWNTYQKWILEGAQQAAAKVTADGGGYVIEWKVRADPCLEVRPGQFWSPALGTVWMGLNIAVGDLDEKEKGAGNFGNFHHEDWWAGEKDKRTWLKQYGTLIIEPGARPAAFEVALGKAMLLPGRLAPTRSASRLGGSLALPGPRPGGLPLLALLLVALPLLAAYPTRTLCGPFEQVTRTPLPEGESPAIPRVRELTDDFGHRYGIGAQTLTIDHPSGERIVYHRDNGLPFGHLTCLARAPGGDVWIGSAFGLLRLTGGRFEVYAGTRWLPDDRVEAVRCEDDQNILVQTAGGACRLKIWAMTFAKKARHFESLTASRHNRFGYVTGCSLLEPFDRSQTRHHIDDNDGLWTAMYVAAEAFCWAACGDQQARERGLASLEALLELERKSTIPGFPARAVCHRSEPEFGRHSDGEWHPCDDPDWEWKADTSSDELDGHYFAWGIAYDLLAGPDEKAAIAEVCARVTDHLIEHGYYLCDLDGQPTRWGVFAPERLNDDVKWFAERGLNSLELLSYLKTAAHITGDSKYQTAARELIEREHYALNTMGTKVMPGDFEGAECNHSDDELAFLSYYNLIRYETDPALRAIYVASLERSWQFERPEACPLWNFLYGALTGQPCDVDNALVTLREIPMDVIDHIQRNSHRWDVRVRPTGDRFDRLELERPVSFRERPLHKWNGNPYRADGGSGRSEECGTFWLLPYWLGRYHGIIDEVA